MTEEYSNDSEQDSSKTVFESLLEKTVKGAENLPNSISLTDESSTKNPFNWKFDNVRYDWKKDFPYVAPEDKITGSSFKRYIAVLIKKYASP